MVSMIPNEGSIRRTYRQISKFQVLGKTNLDNSGFTNVKSEQVI
jgi:hypothetical protein